MSVEEIGVKNTRILAVGIGALVILVGVRLGLTGYFSRMTDREVETKRVAGGVERIHAYRAEEGKVLDRSKGALEQAMKSVADRQRPEPKQSTDNAAVEGWKELQKAPAPSWPLPPPLPAAETGDAGLDGAADGATSDAATDANPDAKSAVTDAATPSPTHH